MAGDLRWPEGLLAALPERSDRMPGVIPRGYRWLVGSRLDYGYGEGIVPDGTGRSRVDIWGEA